MQLQGRTSVRLPSIDGFCSNISFSEIVRGSLVCCIEALLILLSPLTTWRTRHSRCLLDDRGKTANLRLDVHQLQQQYPCVVVQLPRPVVTVQSKLNRRPVATESEQPFSADLPHGSAVPRLSASFVFVELFAFRWDLDPVAQLRQKIVGLIIPLASIKTMISSQS